MNIHKPRGFSDALFADAARREALSARIGSFFADAGYELAQTPSVEYADSNARANDAFRFVDVDGRLLALRTDVTLPLARVVASRFSSMQPPYRLRYCADVFREQESLRGSDRQFTQLGIECFGLEQATGDLEVLSLALGGLRTAGINDAIAHISDVSVVQALLNTETSDTAWRQEFNAAWHAGDFIAALALVADGTLPAARQAAVTELLSLRGGSTALNRAETLLKTAACPAALAALKHLRTTFNALLEVGWHDFLCVDFSLTPSFDYYSGLVFELYVPRGAGDGLLLGSGGRYDTLLTQFGRELPAAGFVYELPRLEAAVMARESALVAPMSATSPPPLRIAVPKGKLYTHAIALLGQAGIHLPGLAAPGRTLRFVDEEYEIIIAKPSDVAIYVSYGAVDCGIGGRDILVEADFPLLQLLDLHFGECEFVVAAPENTTDTLDDLALKLGTVRVATKYPRLTQSFFDARGVQAEIVKLNGNIELAPLIGIADVIVDITQTGTTLKENKLRVVEYVQSSTARFVANTIAARTDCRLAELCARLSKEVNFS